MSTYRLGVINAYLDSLGDTPLEVADNLRKCGVPLEECGTKMDNCPLARYAAENMGLGAYVLAGSHSLYEVSQERLEMGPRIVFWPKPVRKFIRMWDAGERLRASQ